MGNLGATVYFTSTVTVSVSEGLSSDEQVAGASSTNTNTSTSTPESTMYSSKVGPLVGLLGVTDERLGSISLVGNPTLVDLAESFLLKIDAKQRQVALDIQILDFDLDNEFVASNTSFFRDGNNFIISRDGSASALIGDIFPPTESQFREKEHFPKVILPSPQLPFVPIPKLPPEEPLTSLVDLPRIISMIAFIVSYNPL